jgi:hypothetical protein
MLIAYVVLAYTCNTSNTSNFESRDSLDRDSNLILVSTIEVFNTMPSPIETADLIHKSGAQFDQKILNPVKNLPYYETSQSMALNLGIYCADISYTSFYNQKQITMEYLSSIKTLAESLGLINLIKQSELIKLEENLYQQDSLKVLVKDIFLNSGKVLNDNNRPETALMVVVGGWIEGMYIAMQLARQSGAINKELVDRVSEQKNSLMLVTNSLEKFSSIQQINTVLTDMRKLEAIYNTMLPLDNKSDKKNLLTTPQNINANITPEIFLSLFYEINKIRNSYTQ